MKKGAFRSPSTMVNNFINCGLLFSLKYVCNQIIGKMELFSIKFSLIMFPEICQLMKVELVLCRFSYWEPNYGSFGGMYCIKWTNKNLKKKTETFFFLSLSQIFMKFQWLRLTYSEDLNLDWHIHFLWW